MEEILGDSDDTHTKERVMDLEGLEERSQSQRYQQKMAKAFEQAVHSRIFTLGQLVLRVTKHVRRNIL